MDGDPLANIKSLLDQAESYAVARDWAFVGHLMTQAAIECLAVAEKAMDGGHALDGDFTPGE